MASMSEFVKHDADKLRFDLVDPCFEAELADILTHGARKYADDNWKNAEPAEAKARYYAAFRRHMNAWVQGEAIDPDSGRPHLICAACSLMFLRWFERQTHPKVPVQLPVVHGNKCIDADHTHSWNVPITVPK
jgi:hypothetical protein